LRVDSAPKEVVLWFVVCGLLLKVTEPNLRIQMPREQFQSAGRKGDFMKEKLGDNGTWGIKKENRLTHPISFPFYPPSFT
jgi:hypothetical protein